MCQARSKISEQFNSIQMQSKLEQEGKPIRYEHEMQE